MALRELTHLVVGEEPADLGSEDPKTAALQTDVSKLGRIISLDPDTGKFYIHPGTADLPVTLQGEPVLAPTELRRGDTIRVGSELLIPTT